MTDNTQPELQPEPATIDELIENLPEQFPVAEDMIKFEIAPHLIECNPGVRDHYIKVINKRKNIGLYQLVIDSRLLPMGSAGSDALAMKNSGHYGAGKSFPLFTTLKLYPKSTYRLISSGSEKSLYSIEGGLQHQASPRLKMGRRYYSSSLLWMRSPGCLAPNRIAFISSASERIR